MCYWSALLIIGLPVYFLRLGYYQKKLSFTREISKLPSGLYALGFGFGTIAFVWLIMILTNLDNQSWPFFFLVIIFALLSFLSFSESNKRVKQLIAVYFPDSDSKSSSKE